MLFLSIKKGFSTISILLIGALALFTIAASLINKTKIQLNTQAASCVPITSVSTSKSTVDIGECFDCLVNVSSGGGSPNIACGLSQNGGWPQNICPSDVAYTGCSGFKGWSGNTATFGCQMPSGVSSTANLEMVGFDFQAVCGPANGSRVQISLTGSTPVPPTSTPTPNPNCPNGKVDQSGQCNSACCSTSSECNDPYVPGQSGQVCTVSNGYCNSGYSCAAAPTSAPTVTSPPGSFTPTPTPIPSSSPTPSPNPTSTPTPLPPIPPAQACHLGQEIYQFGESYCDEAGNTVKTCLGNDNWQRLQNPDPCPGTTCTNDQANHTYSCVAKCQPLVNNPGNKLKIAFLPEHYTDPDEFKIAARDAINQIKKTNLGSLINKMNFYFIYDFYQSYHVNPSQSYDGILWQKIHDTGANLCGADSSIVIDNPASCGNGNGGVAPIGGLAIYVCGIGDIPVPHELGHALALLYDEYGNANSPLVVPDIDRTNCSFETSNNPSTPCPKWSGMPGAGCYEGCGGGGPKGYSRWYRSTQLSIMRGRYEQPNISYTFNPPSLKAWEDILRNYQ